MRNLLLLLVVLLTCCENSSFDSDKRQLIAKDEIRRQLNNPRGFDITSFKEDTLQTLPNTTGSHPIQYSMDFKYTDSTGRVTKKKGVVLFTADGKSVITVNIVGADS